MMSVYCATSLAWSSESSSVTIARPVSLRALASSFSPAAKDRGASGLHRLGSGEQLPLAFHRTRAGHDLNFPAPDHNAAHVDGGIGRVRLAADQFEALLHRHHAFHGLRKLRDEIFQRLVRQFVADGPDHRPGHAPHDVGAVAESFDFLQHSGLGFLRDVGFENDNHGFSCGTTL